MTKTQSPTIAQLKELPLFATLEASELESLRAALTGLEVRSGKFVIREGSESDDMYIIARGKLKVCRADKGGKEVVIALCGPGDIVGEIALLTGSKRTADVISVAPSFLWRWPREAFLTHAARYPGVLHQLLIFMAHRVRRASSRITDLALYEVTYRVAHVLLELSSIATRDEAEVHVINERPTHQTLASMVGSSREAVTRALHLLESEGHIEFDDERVWLYSLP